MIGTSDNKLTRWRRATRTRLLDAIARGHTSKAFRHTCQLVRLARCTLLSQAQRPRWDSGAFQRYIETGRTRNRALHSAFGDLP